ncbi:uncharacterized protein LOC124171501 [Ischnura elegans]|uniref:uncharacterized protein LOC124171501 n=1 Tax=Ischnura elegans TaxID=197161 RepID=UPI001ED8BBC9|nr:uncharacterized protein LOC124171501 [Ischnura elegans]
MNFHLLLFAIAVSYLIVNMGYDENYPPPLDKLVSATEINDHNALDVVKEQGIGGGENSVGGAEVMEITTGDIIQDAGLDHISPGARGSASTSIASTPLSQEGDHEKDMNDEQKMDKPSSNRKGGANEGKSDPGSMGNRNEEVTTSDLGSDHSNEKTKDTQLSRNADQGPKPAKKTARQTIIETYIAFLALLYLGNVPLLVFYRLWN